MISARQRTLEQRRARLGATAGDRRADVDRRVRVEVSEPGAGVELTGTRGLAALDADVALQVGDHLVTTGRLDAIAMDPEHGGAGWLAIGTA